MRIGIDFGTTRTVVALCDRGNYPVVGFSGADGETLEWYPSVIAESNGELRAGLDALAVVGDPSWTVTRSFKRLLSRPGMSPETPISVGSITLPLVEIAASFLQALRRDLLERSNLRTFVAGRDVDVKLEAVVATPANSHNTQRFVTLDAFRRAGFDVFALINEPSAAGFEYAHRHRSTITARREHVVVYDLGGGTFDASLVRMTDRAHEVLATSGIAELGGDDFDALLADLVLKKADLRLEDLDQHQRERLFDDCREAKERLHPNTKRLSFDLVGLGEGRGMVDISTSDYYSACAPLVQRTIDALSLVFAEIGLPRSGAACDPSSVDDETSVASELEGVYVVGGASALPVVARVLRERFGRRVHRTPYPSAATAIGLAIAFDDRASFALSDRFSRNFGVFREAHDGTAVAFDPIFRQDLVIPTRDGKAVQLERVYRAAHNVGHFRFVECGTIDESGGPTGDITPFADVFFPFESDLRAVDADLPSIGIRRTGGVGPLVRERYQVDAQGIVELTITDLDTGYERHHRLGA